MKIKFAVILIVFSLNSFAQEFSKSWKDINYANDQHQYHLLDIYLPKGEKNLYPLVIAIYGSAWFGNNLKQNAFTTFGSALLKAGFAVVTPNHRSSYDAKFPTQINDIKAVIRFIRANADKYQLDTSFIGITGFSSGGHLAALAGTSRFVKEYTIGNVTFDLDGKVGQYLSYSSSVDAVVDWFGPTDFLVMDSCRSNMIYNSPNAPEAILIGGPVQDNKEKSRLANPITYVDESDPPFLIIHGDKDPLVPLCQSELLHSALQRANVYSEFIRVPNGEHGPGVFEEKYFKLMTDFFLKQNEKTGLINDQNDILTGYSLEQNYPNPFNSYTIINFTLPVKSLVTLKIYNLLG